MDDIFTNQLLLSYWTWEICMKVNKRQETFTSEELLYIDVQAKVGTLLKREKTFLVMYPSQRSVYIYFKSSWIPMKERWIRWAVYYCFLWKTNDAVQLLSLPFPKVWRLLFSVSARSEELMKLHWEQRELFLYNTAVTSAVTPEKHNHLGAMVQTS